MKTSASLSDPPVGDFDEPAFEPVTKVTKRRGASLRRIVIILLITAGLVWTVRYVHRLFTHAETDNAYVTGHIHQVSSRLAGTLVKLLVEENTKVEAGAVLAELDPRDYQSKVVQADALLALANAKVEQATADVAESRAKLAQAETAREKAELDFQRAEELASTRVVSKQELDAARATNESARAGVDSAHASVTSSEAALIAARAQLNTANAYLVDARLQLSYCTIIAPVAGRIGRRNAELGNRVQAGQPLFALVQPEVWIEANYKETQLAKMRLGQETEITIDALPGRHFTGKVESFSPASGASFSMLPPDNATGNFTKVVQRVPVHIALDPESIRDVRERLRPGLSAIVAVRLGEPAVAR